MVDDRLRLVLVAKEVEHQKIYLEKICGLNIECDLVDEVGKLDEVLIHHPCSGLLLDVLSTMRCSEGEKAFVHDLLEIYPMLRLRCNSGTGEVSSIMYGSGERIDINEFVDKHCRSFSPRRLRTSARVYRHFRILFAQAFPVIEEQAQKSVTINLSAEGCFIYTIGQWQKGERIWVVFPDFEDKTPIAVEVRWVQPWGPGGSMPGIGVHFLSTSSSQQQAIDKLTGHHSRLHELS